MRYTNDQFEALAYIFEKELGNTKSEYEEKIITESGLDKFDTIFHENELIEGLNNGIYDENSNRVSAYWILGKRFNKKLIPYFKEWLKKEVEIKAYLPIYQLLIALENLGEEVFNSDRDGGSSFNETELNYRDAVKYLKANST